MENKYIKNYRIWHQRKEILDNKEIAQDFYCHEREVWWAAVGVNVGVEMDGKHDNFERPVLVLKKLNKDQFFGLPITSGNKRGSHFLYVEFGDMRSRYLCLSQLRVFSSKRLLRRIDRIEKEEFKKIRGVTQNIF